VGQLAHAVRDQLQDAIQVQHAGDAAGGRVQRGQLVGGLPGSRLRPRRPDDDLEAAGALVDREHGRRRGVQLQRRQGAVAEPKFVGAQAGRFDAFVRQAAGTHFDLGQRLGVEVEMAATEPGTGHDVPEGLLKPMMIGRARIAAPCLQGRGHVAQTEQAGGVPANLRRRVRCGHQRQPSRPTHRA
jgi:hypothetical protein